MKKHLLFFASFLSVYFVNAQINFEERINIYDETYGLTGEKKIISVDFDNDSDLDLLLFNTEQFSQIYWYENVNGDFNHNPRKLIDQMDYLYAVNVGDLDGDGFLDIVALSLINRLIVWYKNINGIQFSAQQEIISLPTQFNRPTFVYLEDIDDDQNVDVIFGTQNDGGLFWMKNLGDGAFDIPNVLTSQINGTVSEIKFKDINNDGKKDLFIGMGNGNLYFMKKLSEATFETPVLINSSIAYGVGFDFLDYNNDNIYDIVIADDYDEKLGYIETNINQTNGNISFSDFTLFRYIDNLVNVKIDDHDNDGFEDIYISTSNELLFLKNTGEESLNDPISITDYVNFPKNFEVNDFNNDQIPDLVVCSTPSSSSQIPSRVSLFKNVSNNDYFEEYIDYNFSVGKNIYIEDFNNDGIKDILNFGYFGLVWFQNRGNLDLSSYKPIKESIKAENSTVWESIVVDINDDGYLDFIATYEGSYIMRVFINNQNNGFNLVNEYTFQYPDRFMSINLWDFDNDGLKDIIFLNNNSVISQTRFFWIRNVDGEQFDLQENIEEITTINTNQAINKFKIGDVNNDGLLDIVGASSEYWTLQWFENMGNGAFETHHIANSIPVDYIEMKDVNNDNYLDIFTYKDDNYSPNGYAITYLKNNNGTFNRSTIDNQVASSLAFADVNNDGLIDIVGTSREYLSNSGDKVFLYLNNGSNYGNRIVIEENLENFSLRGINILDLNNDNKIDLIVSHGNNYIGYYLNNSTLEVQDVFNEYNDFTLYPNPFSETINWSDNRTQINNSNYTILIRDLTGKSIYHKTIINTYLDLKFLQKGVYLFTIQSAGNSATYKIIKK